MSPTPTGRLFGNDLVLTRTFRAPVSDVWASLTDPERTVRRLILDCRIPPPVEMEDMIRRCQVKTGASGFK